MKRYLWIILFMLGVICATRYGIYINNLIKEHIEITKKNEEIRRRNEGYGGRASFKTNTDKDNGVIIIILKQEE